MKKHIFTIALLLVVCLLSAFIYLRSLHTSKSYAEINSTKVYLEVAATPEQMEKGLSDRSYLAPDSGMLFVFPEGVDKRPGFWMKSMLISLDLLWIKDGKVVQISPGLPPDLSESPKVYHPDSEVDYVLEVNAGWSAKHGVEVGMPISLHL